MSNAIEKTIIVNGEEMTVYRIDNDYYGNPRYVIHFLSLGLKEYESTKKTRQAGLKIYRAKWFGGGFVTQSYNIERDIERAIEIIKGESKCKTCDGGRFYNNDLNPLADQCPDCNGSGKIKEAV